MNGYSTMNDLAAEIQQRTLGRTGLRVKMLGVGGISSQDVFEKALEYGLNFFDVNGYEAGHGLDGRIRFKNAMRRTGTKREDVILTARCNTFTREGALAQIDESLELLETDYLDLYGPYNVTQVSDRVEKTMAPGGALEGLKEAKAAGKIRFIGGVSGHHHKELVQLLKTNAFDAVMIAVNVFDQDVIAETLPVAKALNIGTIAMKPFAKGLFTKSVEAPLRYVFAQDITVAIPGMYTLAELEKNIRTAAEFSGCSEADMALLSKEVDEIAKAEGKYICRQGGYCVPVCPQEIDIKQLFYMQRQANRYYSVEWAKKAYAEIQKNAKDCIECGSCETECPYDLPIREMLKQVHQNLCRVPNGGI